MPTSVQTSYNNQNRTTRKIASPSEEMHDSNQDMHAMARGGTTITDSQHKQRFS